MKRYTGFIILIFTFICVISISTESSGKKPSLHEISIDSVNLVNLKSSRYDSLLLVWEQLNDSNSQIMYRQIRDNKFNKLQSLTKPGNYVQPSVDYSPDSGLYISFTQVSTGFSDIIVVGSREIPAVAEKKINFKNYNGHSSYLLPDETTDFKNAVKITDGTGQAYDSDVTADKNGVHAVWVSQNRDDVSTSEIIYRYIGTDTSTGMIPVSASDGHADIEPVIVKNPVTDEVHIFWAGETPGTGYDIYHTHGTYNRDFWIEPPVASSIYDDVHPQAAVDDEGTIYLVYETGDEINRDIKSLYLESGATTWIDQNVPVSATANDQHPSVDIDRITHVPVIAWENDEYGSICVKAKEFCSGETVCDVTDPGPYYDLIPSIAASGDADYPTVTWCRYFTGDDPVIYIKGPQFPDDEEIE